MSSFSERYGYIPVRMQLQYDEMDRGYRVAVWNLLHLYTRKLDHVESAASAFHMKLWALFWQEPIDELPRLAGDLMYRVKNQVLEQPFHRVYDLIEFVLANCDDVDKKLALALNHAMEANLAPFRIVNGRVLKVDQDSDVDAIEQALSDTSVISGARHHLEQALSHLADRENPDYANSIKESVSAIEATCRRLTNSPGATLADALKALKASGVSIHPALERGWRAIYGYTSDADGIRHAATEAPDISQAEARYFLVSCSAFASLLIQMAQEAGLLQDEPLTDASNTAAAAAGGALDLK